MSYLRRLDQARARLGEGNLLAAEHELREATREWKSSRLRAPLVEKGLEPALRTLGKVFGRKSDEPVLPVYARRAELLREDLHAFARALAVEVLEDVARVDLDPGRRHVQATEALSLQRSSEFFALAPTREWQVVRVWLADGRRLGAGIRAELLPAGPPPDEDAQWWLEWLEQWCDEPAEPVRAFADWGRRVALRYGGMAGGPAERWSWVQARLAMLDPLAAPLALEPVERVLEMNPGAELAAAALVSWAELVTNLRLLATAGGNARDLLEARSMEAARIGLTWPPATISQRLPERRPIGGDPVLVAVHAHDDGTAIALVLHDGRRACDVLCIKPAADPDPSDPFSMDDAAAQRRIAAWLPPDSILLSASEPGPRLRGLVGSARWIPVEQLLELFGCDGTETLPAAPASSHPAWTREICAPWDTLVPGARRLLPALENLLETWPSLATEWGRANLRRLGTRGVALADALADAAALVALAGRVEPVLATAPPLSLAWPRLVDRPWPELGPAAGTAATAVGTGRVWIDRAADAGELAAVASQGGATNLLCVGEERALELAAAVASTTDPMRVSIVGLPVPCVAPLLELLNRWITESPGDLERGRASVWLLGVLSESVGPVEPLLESCAESALVEEVRANLAPCTGQCGSHTDGSCWDAQSGERVDASHVTVVDVSTKLAGVPGGRRTVADDLRRWVVEVDDTEALRRLHALPAGGEPVVVFTPGLEFLVSLLGGIPMPDGGDGGWEFIAGDERDGAAIWTAPPGYGPRSIVLAREARGLVEERARRWTSDVGDAPLWGEDIEDRAAAIRGVADSPAAETVLVPSLGEASLVSALLMGLRLAAAASHASGRAVCLSPALAETLGVGGGLIHGEDDEAVPRALDGGSVLLSGRRGRPSASWTSPLTRPRLEQAGATRARDISAALHRWSAGRGRILAGTLEDDRQAVIHLLCRLQSEALDGGPLGVRAVVVVQPDPGEFVAPPEARLRALDRGRELVVHFTPAELGAPEVEDWARRSPSIAWVFRNAETLLDPALQEGVKRLLSALRRCQARALFFTDHVADARRVRELVNPQFAIEPVSVIEEFQSGLDPAAWETRTLGSLPAQCPSCDRSVVYRTAFELCPECGVPIDGVASVRRTLRVAFESRVVDALRQLGPQATWSLLVFDPGRRSRLRQRLGLDHGPTDEAPLLREAEANPSAEVLLPDELWRSDAVRGPVIVCGLPAGAREWSVVEGRLRARGIPAGQWWLGPPGLDESELLPAAETRFELSREEFLEVFSRGEDRIHATATLRRLEAAGGTWDATPAIRVHELVRTAQSDDAPLVALARASKEGWLRGGAVVGLEKPPAARFERAVRTGQRLREDGGARVRLPVSEGGRMVGIGGWGKTARLLKLASESAANGDRVLVLVPDATGRLEWVEKLADPGVTCLDFDEFLLDLVGKAADLDARSLRVLPPADRSHGEEVRLSLVHRVSELYAAETGELPGVDSRSLVRALEGEYLAADPVGAPTSVDFDLLARCVGEARTEGGWTDSRQLLGLARSVVARHPDGAGGEFAVVLVDDAHDLPDSGLDFLRELFGVRLRASGVDPVLGLVAEADVEDTAMESRRFGPEIAEAIERVWRSTTPLPAPVRGRRPGRCVAESERILALTTATERIAEELTELEGDEQVAIVAAHERDRRMMEQQLSVRSIGVDGPDRDLVDLVTGPREVIAALAWTAGDAGDESVGLLSIILAAGPEPSERDDAAHYEARLRRRLDGETVEVLDRVEAFVLPLVLIRSAIGPSTRVDRAVEVLLGCGLLHRLTDQPGMMRRLENFVRQYRDLTVSELLESIPAQRVLRPSTGGERVRILAPDQLAGRSFDRIYYICTGFEPPERHYRVLSRARSAVKIACSEVDPLQG